MTTDRELLECKCSFRIRMVGDGCRVCNPEYWDDFFKRQEDDAKKEGAAEEEKE